MDSGEESKWKAGLFVSSEELMLKLELELEL